MQQHGFDADVIIVGAGPAGTTLANLLGGYGVKTIVLEREADIIDYPRAVGMDDEALRAFQTVGLAQPLLKDMIQNTLLRYHHSNGKMFAEVGPKAKPFGWPRRNLFIQPLSEKVIRGGITRFPHVQILQGHAVDSFTQDADGVTVIADTAEGKRTFRAPYMVGCDGGRSTVRKGCDIALLGDTHPWRWLVVDLKNDDRFEPFSAIYCDPQRPYIVIDLPYGHRRFEFRLRPEDTDEKMADMNEVKKMLHRHIPGEDPEIIRARIYTHHSRIAARFQEGRIFIAGDAAHLQPPFFGQGLNSGLRDVMNLSWKLAMVTQGAAGPELLKTYDAERRHHAEVMVKFATGIGKFYAPYSKFTEMFRKAFFWGVQRLPSLRDYVLQMKFKPMPFYENGIVDHSNAQGKSLVGRMFPQPRVADANDTPMLMDDAIGKGFSIIGINTDPAKHLSVADRDYIDSIAGSVVQINRSRRGTAGWSVDARTTVLDDLDGQFRDMLLKAPKQQFFILRPDRYVFAVCEAHELSAAVARLKQQLGTPVQAAHAIAAE